MTYLYEIFIVFLTALGDYMSDLQSDPDLDNKVTLVRVFRYAVC